MVPIDVKQTRFLENLTYSTQIIYQLAVAAAALCELNIFLEALNKIFFLNISPAEPFWFRALRLCKSHFVQKNLNKLPFNVRKEFV